MAQPAVARIESGRVVPRVDTLAALLAACGIGLNLEPRPDDGLDRSEIRALLRVGPQQRLLSLPESGRPRFRPLHALRILAARRVRFVVVGEVAARLHGAPVVPSALELALDREWLNPERLARALDAIAPMRDRAEHRADPRTLRAHRRHTTRFGTIDWSWPPAETYRRLVGASSEMPLAMRPVRVASIDDLIERWRGGAAELELLRAVREEMDRRAVELARRGRE